MGVQGFKFRKMDLKWDIYYFWWDIMSKWGFKFRKIGYSMGNFWDFLLGLRWYLYTFSTGHGDTDSVVGISIEIGYDQLMDMDGIMMGLLWGKTSDISRLMDDLLDMIMDMNGVSMEVWYDIISILTVDINEDMGDWYAVKLIWNLKKREIKFYPLVMSTVCYWKWPIYSWLTH